MSTISLLNSRRSRFGPTFKILGGRASAFLHDESGPAAVEYAVMLALILVVCINIVSTLGRTVSTSFGKVNGTMSS